MTLLKALVAQLLGLAVALGLMELGPVLIQNLGFTFVQGLSAAICAKCLKQAPWWLAIHLVFLPGAAALLSLQISEHWYLLAAIILILVYWGVIRGDAPLFLSSCAVTEAIHYIIIQEQAQKFADLGAGIGSVTIPLAKKCPNVGIHAFENAPIPWIIHSWRCRKLPNIKLYRSNFWRRDFARYDVAFAFLSPGVMPDLGAKVRLSMCPGSLFISASFPVPGWEPEAIKTVNDGRGTLLFCYRIVQATDTMQ